MEKFKIIEVFKVHRDAGQYWKLSYNQSKPYLGFCVDWHNFIRPHYYSGVDHCIHTTVSYSLMALGHRLFSKKIPSINTCIVLIRIIIAFENQTFMQLTKL